MSVTRSRARKPVTTIRTLWAIAKSPELSLTSDDLHAVVYRETGKESLKKLSRRELTSVACVLQAMKDRAGGRKSSRRTDKSGNPKTVAQRKKIYLLCEQLGWNDDNRRISGFAKRMCGVDRIEWLNVSQCGIVIEALKKMIERQEAQNNGEQQETESPD